MSCLFCTMLQCTWEGKYLLKILISVPLYAAAAAKSLQSCPTLCDRIDGSPSGSPVPGILQARTLEWVAISFSNAGKWKVKVKSLSRVWLLATPWTVARQAPPSLGFSWQEYWRGVPLPSLFLCINIHKLELLNHIRILFLVFLRKHCTVFHSGYSILYCYH